jgi:ssDNA-binding Zn-finger/Zn-ribbon topoisomerase 1
LTETIVCPKCGEVFDKPLLQKKKYGFGFGLANLTKSGDYKCPKCGYKSSADEFAPGPSKD